MHTPTESDLAHAADWLKSARRVVVLTGAGVSAESGVPTFRDANGLWEGHAIEEVATPAAFARNPELVWRSTTSGGPTSPPCGPTPATSRSPNWKPASATPV